MDRLAAMSMFVRVVETGSFSSVARELNTTQPTVSKNVAELETWLGAKLLSRSTRALHMTEAGADYYERCINILQDIEEAESAVGQLQTAPKGKVRISTVVAFGRLHVIPLLKEFFERFPDIKVDIVLSDRTVDLVEEGVDLAIRFGPLSDSSLIAKKLCVSPFATVASHDYLERYGVPAHPRDLKDHNYVIYTGLDNSHEIEFSEDGKPFIVRVDGKLLSNNSEAVREAILQGFGICQVPRWLVGAELESGDLQEVLQEFSSAPREIFAVYPPGRHLASKARHFIDYLAEKFADSALIQS